MQYTVKTVDKFSFDNIDFASVSFDNWNVGYKPETAFRGVYVKNEGFYFEIKCREKDPRRVCFKNGGNVWEDSCLEWFVNFDPEHSGKYMNIEMNANGVTHFGVGEERHGRKQIVEVGGEYPEINAEINENDWSVTVFLPLRTIEKVFGKIEFKKGCSFKGNVYKCGDMTEKAHYLSWNPIGTEKPDFHRPEFFGEFIIG